MRLLRFKPASQMKSDFVRLHRQNNLEKKSEYLNSGSSHFLKSGPKQNGQEYNPQMLKEYLRKTSFKKAYLYTASPNEITKNSEMIL